MTEDFNWQHIVFKECTVHPMIRYVGDKCPVCAAEEKNLQLQNQIASLEMGRATAAAE